MPTEKNTDTSSNGAIEDGDLSKLLNEYRTEAQLGIDQVAEALCLPGSSVTALENEEFDKLPESPYIRGYLRTYSRLADKDPAQAITIYEALRGADTKNDLIHTYTGTLAQNTGHSKPLLSESRVRLGMFALLLLVLGLLTMTPGVKDWAGNVWNSFSSKTASEDQALPGENLTDPDSAHLAGEIPGNLPVSQPMETQPENNQEEASANTTPEEQDESKPAETQSTTTTDTATTTAENREQPTPDTQDTKQKTEATNKVTQAPTPEKPQNNTTETAKIPSTETTPQGTGNTSLRLTFSDEVWLRIRDDNKKTIFEALNPPGTEKILQLPRPMKFTVGNAPGLTLYVDGVKMDIEEYTKGSVARFGIE